MTRNTFAGATFSLLTEDCRDDVWDAPPEEFGARYLEGVSEECLNAVDLREWLRNAPEKKPMYTDPEELSETDNKTRGMPYLALSEDQIDLARRLPAGTAMMYLDPSVRGEHPVRHAGRSSAFGGRISNGDHRASRPAVPAPVGRPSRPSPRRRRSASSAVPSPAPAGGRGCSPSTTSGSGSCTASPPSCSSSSAASRPC